MRRSKVIVGLSGGVDSAVAALQLLEQGFRVEGLFMKNWEEDDTDGYCSAADDYRMARAVCEHLEIGLHAVNFATEYWERVFAHFLAELRAGRTPNPDVLCNKEIKFKAFLEHALALGADFIATGHYAHIEAHAGGHRLLKGADTAKDQSYFLYTLGQPQLARALFPLGRLRKAEVRALARAAGLPNHDRRDSTGICFIGERDFKHFLARYLPGQPGEIRALDDGRLLGRHDGLVYYTLGQRHGLGLGGPGEAWYVAEKDLARNVLYVAQGRDHPALYSRELVAGGVCWVSGKPPALPLACRAKVRYRQTEQPCTVARADGGRLRVRFEDPQWAVTPGQSVVFYDGEVCLGGAVIESRIPLTGGTPPRTAARSGRGGEHEPALA